MKKDLERIIEIPEGITVTVNGTSVAVSGNGKKNSRSFEIGKVNLVVLENKLVISAKSASKRESKMMGTMEAHIINMIKGLSEEFIYELEVCNVHFPMNVKVEENQIVIKSFLGEKTQRISKILPAANVKINGSKITVTSHDIEAAGQTAANLEKATKPSGRDRRIFQDGIFITSKCGREI
jgi:large subunit ribosomal protein L6